MRARAIALAVGVALVPLSLPHPAAAQVEPGTTIVRVAVDGSAARIATARDVGVPVGARATRQLLRETVFRLLETGRWAGVQLELVPEPGGVALVAHLVPRLLLARLDVYGNDFFDDSTLRRELELGEDSEIEEGDVPTILGNVRRLYAQRGFEQVRVDAELRDTSDASRKVLVLRIDEGAPTEITQVVFEGDPMPRGSGVLRAMDLDAGDRLDRTTLEESVRQGEIRLRERGWLQAALGAPREEPHQEGVRLVIPSSVGPQFTTRIHGASPLDRSTVYDELRLGSERLTRANARAMQQRVVDLYRRAGFPDARATIRRLPGPRREGRPDPTRAVLEIRIATGGPLRVVARSYPGSRHFDDDYLDAQVDSILAEFLDTENILEPLDEETTERLFATQRQVRERAPPIEDGAAKLWFPEAYERATDHLRELHEVAGYLDARVGPAELQRIDDDRAVVAIPVRLGPRTLLYGVELRGNEALTSREVLEAAGLEREQPFSYLTLEEAKRRIVEAYQARGHYYATIESDVRFSSDRTRAQLLLRVNERFPVHVGEVVVRGAITTNERLVRRVVPLERGALLTPALLRRTQDRLLELGVFASVNVTPRDPELAARVKPVEIVLAERKTQYLDFRAGLSTAQGARFGLSYGYRNLFGTAMSLTLAAQFGYQFFFLDSEVERRFQALSLQDRLERRVSASLGIPFIGLPSVRTALGVLHQRENERNFGLTRNSVDLTFTWRAHRTVNVQFSSDIENNDVEVLGGESYEDILEMTIGDVRLRNLLRVPEGKSTLVASQLGITLDRRDNPFVPTRGFLVASSAEWARTISAEAIERAGEVTRFFSHHVRLQLTGSGYVPFGSRNQFVFATQLKLGRVVHLEDRSGTYPNRQFFVGGVGTMRGYLQDAMIPQDLADEIEAGRIPLEDGVRGVVQGGDTFFVARGELRFPIAGELRGGAFVDLGNLWIEPGQLNPLELRPTAGLGLRIGTPVGPIALDYGILLARREFLDEPFGSFHFSIGLF